MDSHLFDFQRPTKTAVEEQHAKVSDHERVCWDTKDSMVIGVEVSRRARLKAFEEDVPQTALQRKQEEFGSTKVREGLGTTVINTGSPRKGRNDPGRMEVQPTPKDMKIAFLQSSIFS